MSDQHTQGEWKAERGILPPGWTEGWLIEANDLYSVGFVADNNGMAQNEANARLIAASPELLSALQSIISRQGKEDAIHGTAIKLPFELEAKARAAIAKAQGK